jgi:recombination protein RecA
MSDDTRAFVARLNKALKEEIVVFASDLAVPRRFTSGSLSLDVILGGGWPGNQWIELIGKESMGKTFVALKTIAANQSLDPDFNTFWVAAEHYDSEQAEAIGVDNSRVTVASTQSMETAFALMLEATESKIYDAIILDSYAALLPGEEDEKAMDEFTTATGARLVNKFIRKAGKAGQRATDGSERPFIGIIVNQFRDKIGGFSPFGTPQTTPGGNGKNYFYYARVEVSRAEFITEKRPGIDKPVSVGQTIRFRTIKNKSAAPQQVTTTDIYFRGAPFLGYKRGEIDVAKEYIAMGRMLQVITQAGAYFRFAGDQWQGVDKLKAAIRENDALRETLAKEVLDAAVDPKILDKLHG